MSGSIPVINSVQPVESAVPRAELRWRLLPEAGKVLQQAWIVTRTYQWGEIIDQRIEWRDVPMVGPGDL